MISCAFQCRRLNLLSRDQRITVQVEHIYHGTVGQCVTFLSLCCLFYDYVQFSRFHLLSYTDYILERPQPPNGK